MKVPLSTYMDEKLVAFINGVHTRDEALDKIVDLLSSQGKLIDKKGFLKAVLNREMIVSTGIGMGVAIPHAKLHDHHEFFLAIGILSRGVDWNALDGAPVRLIFMMGGPDDKQNEYLQVLSSLTLAIRSEERRKKILQSHSGKEIIGFFESF